MKRVIALLGILVLCFSIPIKKVASIEAEGFKKLAVSAENLFVLNREQKLVRVLTHTRQETGQILIKPQVSTVSVDPVDIVYSNKILFILDQANCEVWQYTPEGTYLGKIDYISRFLQQPSALYVKEESLWIADTGTIWLLKRNGSVDGRIELPSSQNGLPALISDITVDRSTLYLVDSASARIFVYTLPESSWENPVLKETIGGYGHEQGRFLYPTGIAVYGCVFVSELRKGMNSKLTRIHPYTGECSYMAVQDDDKSIPETSQMTDIVCWGKTLWGVNIASSTLSRLDLSIDSPVKASIDLIDFGSSVEKYVSSKSFTLYSESGLPMSGSLTCDNNVFSVHPTRFEDVSYQMFTVNPDEKNIQAEARETGIITVETESGVQLTIEVRFKKKADKDFILFYPGHADSVKENDTVPLQVLKQNGLEGTLLFSLETVEVPFVFTWKADNIPISTDRVLNALSVKPIGRPISGFYSVPIIVKCPEEKIIKSFSISFLYRAMASKVPGTILGEYFAADWCPYCPSAVKSFPELRQLYTQDQIVFLTYYNDCMADTPARLCFDEGEARMKWYNPVGMHRIMVMDGTNIIESGYNDGVTTMTREYDAYIKNMIPVSSTVSLTGTAKWDEPNRELLIGATVQATQSEMWGDLRLFCVLAEHGIQHQSENGMKEHNYVVRDLLALTNPENNEAFGTPVTAEDGHSQLTKDASWWCHLTTTVDPLVKIENAFCILFVQDILTKQVYQARYVSLAEIPKTEIQWITERERIALSQTKTESVKTWLVNRGNRIDRFQLEIFNRQAFVGNDTWKVNGKEHPVSEAVSVLLNPMETVLVELTIPPGWGKPESSSFIEMKAKASSGQEQYGRIQVRQPDHNHRYQVLFPDESILDESKGWVSDLYKFRCMLKTEPGTFLVGKETIKAAADGVLILPSNTPRKCIGKNSWSVTLRYPDSLTELVTFYYARSVLIELTIGSKEVLLNKAKVIFTGAPFIRKNRTMVPFMDIIFCFACGYKVDWDATTHGITITMGEDVIAFQIGVPYGEVNGREFPLEAPPEIVKKVIYIPLRFFAEALGATVIWDANTQTVTITSSPK